MRANIVDLRYHMKDVLRALDKNKSVDIFYRGKLKAKLVPVSAERELRRAQDQAFFGMSSKDSDDVDDVMRHLRAGRYDDLI